MRETNNEVSNLLDRLDAEQLREVIDDLIEVQPELVTTIFSETKMSFEVDLLDNPTVAEIYEYILKAFDYSGQNQPDDQIDVSYGKVRKLFKMIMTLPLSKSVERVQLGLLIVEKYARILFECSETDEESETYLVDIIEQVPVTYHEPAESNSAIVSQMIEMIITFFEKMEGHLDSDDIEVLLSKCLDIAFDVSHYQQLKSALLKGEKTLLPSDDEGNPQIKQGYSMRESRYLLKVYQKLLAELISKFDTEEEILKFYNNRLYNREFRQNLLDYAITRKEYACALELCTDVEEDIEYVNRNWLDYAYDLYGIQGEIELQKECARKLIMKRHFYYYHKLKELDTEEEWLSDINKLYEECEAQFVDWDFQNVYLRLVLFEKDLPRMLDLCRKSPELLNHFSAFILPVYEKEVLDSLEDALDKVFHFSEEPLLLSEVPKYMQLVKRNYGTTQLDVTLKKLRETFSDNVVTLKQINKFAKYVGQG